jgi:biopolymer transport protein TolR
MALKTELSGRRKLSSSLSEINVTPFVDVMLVLLVIFMVTAPMMKSGIEVDLPEAETSRQPAEEGLIITITKDKYIHLGERVINIYLLEGKLKEYFYGKEKKVVFLRADKEVPYGYVINVLDIIKKAGVEVVGLITLPAKREQK